MTGLKLNDLRHRPQCQCNIESIDHKAGECHGYAVVLAKRNDEVLALCANCTLSTDTDRRNVGVDLHAERKAMLMLAYGFEADDESLKKAYEGEE